MSAPGTPPEVARALADVLERRGLPYAVGGAIALGFYAAPRATLDVDLNVFVPPDERLATVLAALGEAGFTAAVGRARLEAEARSEGQFRGSVAGFRVDVFVPAIAYYGQLAERRRQVPLLGRPIWIVGPEDLVVLKLMFFRRKDLADVEAVLREQGANLDRDYVRRTLAGLAGPGDARVRSLQEIERDVGEPPAPGG